MSYPYPALLPQLRFLTKPAEYRKVTQERKYQQNANFWKIIPVYTYAYCPLCGKVYQEAANTYEFKGWGYKGLGGNLYASDKERENVARQKHCIHFLGIRTFINLHGIILNEKSYFDNHEGEVPLVESHFFNKGLKTYGVLHALPICRIENNAFVPSYTVFTMSYFSENPNGVIGQTIANQAQYFEIDPDYYPTVVQRPDSAKPELFDLAQWTERGQLGWLDFAIPNLPLRIGQGEQLPEIYRAIQGRRKSYIWAKPLPKP